jgi:SAM-dependent methyltransferase
MAQHDRLYQRAVYYDIALQRDISREAAFIPAVYQRHTGTPLHSALDIACGPGYHARALARQGLRAAGLDYSPGMIELAREYAAADGVEVAWHVADMRSFRLDAPVDMAFCMFDGVDALLENDDFIRHFRAVAANLNPRGLYLVDCTHPRICSYQHYGDYTYTGERDGVRVEIHWATNDPQIDPVTGVAEVGVELHIHENGEHQIIRDVARERCLTGQELRLLAALSGVFEGVGWYGDADLNQPLDQSPHAQRMIAVFQKQD